MPRLYVAGPILRETMPDKTRFTFELLYRAAGRWCEIRTHTAYIPDETGPWVEGPFSEGIRGLIKDSTHVLVLAILESFAIGIEAEYAHQLGKPIAIWYPDRAIRSKMLSALSSVERQEGESMDSMLDRLVAEGGRRRPMR